MSLMLPWRVHYPAGAGRLPMVSSDRAIPVLPGQLNPALTLTSLTGEQYTPRHPRVRLHLLITLSQAIPVSQWTSIIGVIVTVSVFYGSTPNAVLASWAGIMVAVAAGRMYQAKQLVGTEISEKQLPAAEAIFGGMAIFQGLVWGVGGVIIPPLNVILSVSYAILILFAVGGGAVVALSVAPRIFISFMFVAYGPPALWLISSASYQQQSLGVILIIYAGFLFALGQRQYEIFLNNIMLSLQNDELVKELRREMEIQQQVQSRLAASEEDLRRAKNEAEAGRDAEERFITAVSHEIRTPMNAVVGFIDLMSKTGLDEVQSEYLRGLRHSSDRLLKIVNDLLEFKRIQAGKIDFLNAPFSLKDVMDQQLSIFSSQAGVKGIWLRYRLDDSIPSQVMGDEARLGQILQNLISNAIKYTNSGGVDVSISLLPDGKEKIGLQFVVSDSGVGIPPGKLEGIFNVYEQVDTRRDSGKGSGLGLSIFKNLVELQGGSVAVESEPGKGTTFRFQLEFGQVESSSETEKETEIDDLLRGVGEAAILLIDDDAVNTYLAIRYLEEFKNLHITTAEDGEKGLAKFAANDFDLILTDINMPIMDGYELAKRIRADFKEPKVEVRIVALTADLIKHENLRAQGIDDFLLKPFTRKALCRRIYENLRIVFKN